MADSYIIDPNTNCVFVTHTGKFKVDEEQHQLVERVCIIVDELAALVEELRGKGVTFRNEILSGPGGSQILCEDPSGNVIELFQAD
jgi:catechol 2,3-dioxygenase-like lactoylglutathione lyase family enzyme